MASNANFGPSTEVVKIYQPSSEEMVAFTRQNKNPWTLSAHVYKVLTEEEIPGKLISYTRQDFKEMYGSNSLPIGRILSQSSIQKQTKVLNALGETHDLIFRVDEETGERRLSITKKK